MSGWLRKALARISPHRAGRKLVEFRITHNPELIAVKRQEAGVDPTTCVAHWADVFRVVAFKRDVFSADLICMEIQDRVGSSIEINEQMEGWKELVAMLPEYLPEFPQFEQWFLRVAQPPFRPCPTELYRRA